MPVITIADRVVSLTVDDLIEYQRKIEGPVRSGAARSSGNHGIAPSGANEESSAVAPSSDKSADWTTASVKTLTAQLNSVQREVLKSLLASDAPVESADLASAAHVERKGIGSVVRSIHSRSQQLGLPTPLCRSYNNGRKLYEVTTSFRTAVTEAGVMTASEKENPV